MNRVRHLSHWAWLNVIGSGMHVIGLTAAVVGGIGMLLDRRGLVSVER